MLQTLTRDCSPYTNALPKTKKEMPNRTFSLWAEEDSFLALKFKDQLEGIQVAFFSPNPRLHAFHIKVTLVITSLCLCYRYKNYQLIS